MKKVFSFVFVMGLSFPHCDFIQADVIEKEVRSSDGRASTAGYVYRHDRSTYRTTGRSRSSRDPVIPAGVGILQVAPISQFTSGAAVSPVAGSKPRFGYGSDYRVQSNEPAPRVESEPNGAEKRDGSEPVPSSEYPDPDIPSVPSYSGPTPQNTPRTEPAAAPDPRPEKKSDPPHSKKEPDLEEVGEIDEKLRRALPFLYEQSEIDATTAKGWSSPRIEFNWYPPVQRDYYRVVPHFFDPFCRPVIPCPLGHPRYFGGPFSGPHCPPIHR